MEVFHDDLGGVFLGFDFGLALEEQGLGISLSPPEKGQRPIA